MGRSKKARVVVAEEGGARFHMFWRPDRQIGALASSHVFVLHMA